MDLRQLAKLINSPTNLSGKTPPIPFTRIVIDSRAVEPGCCFAAIRGARVDGHDYIDKAFEQGASCVISERPHPKGLEVSDVITALQEMARASVKGKRVYALTGAMGKTTTTHFVQTLMPGAFPTTKSNANTKISLPLTILNQLGEAPEIFLEMGMTEPGDIARLVRIAPPKIAMVTYLPAQIEDYIHCSTTETLEELYRGKYEIFGGDQLELALLPDDLPARDIQVPIRRFSLTDPACDYAYVDGMYYEQGKALFPLEGPSARHHRCNFLAAITFARTLGAAPEQIRERAPLLELPAMRFEKSELGPAVLINDAYNASPVAMEAAFKSVGEAPRKVAILGAMLCLGPHTQRGHERVLAAAKETFDAVICYGEPWKNVPGALLGSTHEELVSWALEQLDLEPRSTLYVKGSRDLELERVVEELKKRKGALT